MRLPSFTGCLLLLGLFAAPVSAAERLDAGMRLAATCANCHGTNGVAAGTEFASLAGWPKRDTLAAMQDFRSGKRTATVMHQLAKGYSDDELNLLADYFAAQQRPPEKMSMPRRLPGNAVPSSALSAHLLCWRPAVQRPCRAAPRRAWS